MGRNPPSFLPTFAVPPMPTVNINLPRLPYRRSSKAQTTPAALLCPEVLLVVFEHLRDEGGVYGLPVGMLAAPRVCRAWSITATIGLYERVELLDPHAMRLFLRTLRNTPTLGSLVQSIHLSASFKQRKSRILTKWKWPGVDGVLDILLERCPNLHDLSLDIDQWRVKPLANLIPAPDSLHRLRSLRITSTYAPLVAAVSSGCIELPNLEELTLSGWAIWQDTWTPLPRLRRLNLDRTNLNGPALLSLISSVASTLTHLEFRGLCSVATPHLPEILALLGPTLESLALLENCFCVLSQMSDELKQLTNVRALQVDCLNNISTDFFLNLPPNLREFHLVSSVGYGRSMTIDAALSLFMCNPSARYPLLKTLHVVGDTAEWKPWQHAFLHQRCVAHGLELTLQCWDVPVYTVPVTKPPSPLQKAANATARHARYLVRRICRHRY